MVSKMYIKFSKYISRQRRIITAINKSIHFTWRVYLLYFVKQRVSELQCREQCECPAQLATRSLCLITVTRLPNCTYCSDCLCTHYTTDSATRTCPVAYKLYNLHIGAVVPDRTRTLYRRRTDCRYVWNEKLRLK